MLQQLVKFNGLHESLHILQSLFLCAGAILIAAGWGWGSRIGCIVFAYCQVGRVLNDAAMFNNHDHLYWLLAVTLLCSNAHCPTYTPLARAAAAALKEASANEPGPSKANGTKSSQKAAAAAVQGGADEVDHDYSGWSCILFWVRLKSLHCPQHAP